MLFGNTDVPPLVAILRGIAPPDILAMSAGLIDIGYKFIEVPLNSPEAIVSITKLCETFGNDCVCGAGTVLSVADLESVVATGAKIALAPNYNKKTVESANKYEIEFMPGIASVTEAFDAIACGAKSLKLFPASTYGVSHVKAISAVLPGSIEILAVGGIKADDIHPWLRAGVAGLGLGSNLYNPNQSIEDSLENAKVIMERYNDGLRHDRN